jgi:hypothetical protein
MVEVGAGSSAGGSVCMVIVFQSFLGRLAPKAA